MYIFTNQWHRYNEPVWIFQAKPNIYILFTAAYQGKKKNISFDYLVKKYKSIQEKMFAPEASLILQSLILQFLCTAVHVRVIISFLALFSLLFFMYLLYLLVSPRQDGMPINRKKNQMGENEAKKEIIT